MRSLLCPSIPSFSLLRQRRPAFTLIELLVVIAVISILTSILWPWAASTTSRHRDDAWMKHYLVDVLCPAVHRYAELYKKPPASLNDPRLASLLGGDPSVLAVNRGFTLTMARTPLGLEICAWRWDPGDGRDVAQWGRFEEIGGIGVPVAAPRYCVDIECKLYYVANYGSVEIPVTDLDSAAPPLVPPPPYVLAAVASQLATTFEEHPETVRQARTLLASNDAVRELLESLDLDDDDAITGEELTANGYLTTALFALSIYPEFDDLAQSPPAAIDDLWRGWVLPLLRIVENDHPVLQPQSRRGAQHGRQAQCRFGGAGGRRLRPVARCHGLLPQRGRCANGQVPHRVSRSDAQGVRKYSLSATSRPGDCQQAPMR
jgi:prepilin-type N-terminal cleavage/methylation domain-containing protein